MNSFFNSLPLPYFLLFVIAVMAVVIYCIITMRKGSTRPVLFPLTTLLVNLILLIPTKCLMELAEGSPLTDIFMKVHIIGFLILFISIIFMGIYQYRKGRVKREKRRMFLICLWTLIPLTVIIFTIYFIAIF